MRVNNHLFGNKWQSQYSACIHLRHRNYEVEYQGLKHFEIKKIPKKANQNQKERTKRSGLLGLGACETARSRCHAAAYSRTKMVMVMVTSLSAPAGALYSPFLSIFTRRIPRHPSYIIMMVMMMMRMMKEQDIDFKPSVPRPSRLRLPRLHQRRHGQISKLKPSWASSS